MRRYPASLCSLKVRDQGAQISLTAWASALDPLCSREHCQMLARPWMRRRELLLMGAGLIGARAVHAQQKAMPVIGYLSQRSPTDSASIVDASARG
jgi:hypothetical protein